MTRYVDHEAGTSVPSGGGAITKDADQDDLVAPDFVPTPVDVCTMLRYIQVHCTTLHPTNTISIAHARQ